MAEAMTPGVVNDPKHNVGARNALVQKAFKERFKLEQEEAAAIEKHVQPTKDAIKALNRKLKKDTDIDGKDLNYFYKIFARQEAAKLLDDEADRERIFDNLRATYEAIGGQLDFIEAMDRDDNDDDQPSQAVLDKAHAAGRAASENGEDGTNNPHPEGDPCHTAWNEGWLAAQTDAVNNMGADKADEEAA